MQAARVITVRHLHSTTFFFLVILLVCSKAFHVVPTRDQFLSRSPCGPLMMTRRAPQASRRQWLGQCIGGATTALIVSMPLAPALAESTKGMPVRKTNYTESQFEPMRTRKSKSAPSGTTKKFKPVNVSSLATENKLNVTSYVYDGAQRKTAAVYIDRKDYTIVTVKRLPSWIPKSWRPKQKVEIPEFTTLGCSGRCWVGDGSIEDDCVASSLDN